MTMTDMLPQHTLLKNLTCPACGAVYSVDKINTVCEKPECQSTLYSTYDFNKGLDKKVLTGRPANMWRYRELMPVLNNRNIVSLGEGFTPIIPILNLKQDTQGNQVYWKDESLNPTGSFKARGLCCAVSKAKELGITAVVTATAGNAGGAMSAYAARAGLKATVYMPQLTPKFFKSECRFYGADVVEVDGNISDCGKLAAEHAAQNGWFVLSTMKEPYRLEGKKTMGYEIAEQFNWELPDVILYPTGGGMGLIGIWKAFNEMEQLGWIGSRRPRMVSVQSESCSGITYAFKGGKASAEFKDGGFTIANGLRVPKPYADKIILEILNKSKGTALTVTDSEMNDAVKVIAKNEGMLVAPEGGALWQAFKNLKSSGWIQPGEKILMMNTGSGYKYFENLEL